MGVDAYMIILDKERTAYSIWDRIKNISTPGPIKPYLFDSCDRFLMPIAAKIGIGNIKKSLD